MVMSTKKFEQKMAESNKEFDRQMAERQKEFDRQNAENDKAFNRLRDIFESPWSRLVEYLFKGKLVKLLNERGIEVRQLSQRTECSYTREDGRIQQKEFDIIAVNGDEVVAVEVKTTLTSDKVSYFVESLHDFKKYFKDHVHKSIYGAVAYLRSDSEAHVFAQRQGLFVIRATGDSASLINTKDFKPKAFA